MLGCLVSGKANPRVPQNILKKYKIRGVRECTGSRKEGLILLKSNKKGQFILGKYRQTKIDIL
jgi:hypothetical protein